MTALYATHTAMPAAHYAAGHATLAAALPPGGAADAEPAAKGVAEAAHCQVLRDLFGPLPFRAVCIDPVWLAWHGGAVVKLAQAVYEERELPSGHLDAARLAVLADILEEAGCSDPQLLGHLRGPGPHVRGCFAIDALLGRS
jgi:hypothetical protein